MDLRVASFLASIAAAIRAVTAPTSRRLVLLGASARLNNNTFSIFFYFRILWKNYSCSHVLKVHSAYQVLQVQNIAVNFIRILFFDYPPGVLVRHFELEPKARILCCAPLGLGCYTAWSFKLKVQNNSNISKSILSSRSFSRFDAVLTGLASTLKGTVQRFLDMTHDETYQDKLRTTLAVT